MKILVTGNMGYVGPCVVEHLRAAHPDAVLVGLDTGYFGSALVVGDVLPERLLDAQLFGDVRTPPSDALRDVDAVVHLAAISNDPMGRSFEEPTLDINHSATVGLARAARDRGVSAFVFASSCSIYGAADGEPRTEDSPINPLTAYAISKARAEQDLARLAAPDFRVTCLRFATACGMSPRLRLDLVLNDFVASALAVKRIDILSDGSPWRPLLHVRDMARAIDWAIGRAPGHGAFVCLNAGSDEWNYQVRELAEAVAAIVGDGVQTNINRAAPPDKRSYRVSFERFAGVAPDHQP